MTNIIQYRMSKNKTTIYKNNTTLFYRISSFDIVFLFFFNQLNRALSLNGDRSKPYYSKA